MRGVIHKLGRSRGKAMFSSLNITSLIDLFTILLLFLLFHMAGGADVMPVSDSLKLPESTSEKSPEATVTVMITRDDITIEGTHVASVDEVLSSPELVIAGLKKELDHHANKAKAIGAAMNLDVFQGKVTILGDRQIPFKLLTKVMFTCSQSEFSNIHLAVIQKESI